MYDEVKRRLTWIKLYEETGDAGLVCRRCGISRPTLRKWLQRHAEEGLVGLALRSRRPHRSPNQNVFEQEEGWILALVVFIVFGYLIFRGRQGHAAPQVGCLLLGFKQA